MSGLLLAVLALISGGQQYTEDETTTEPYGGGGGFGGGGGGVRNGDDVTEELATPYFPPGEETLTTGSKGYSDPDPVKVDEYEKREHRRSEDKFQARAKLRPSQPTSVKVGRQQKKIMSIGRDPDQYTLEPSAYITPYVMPVQTKTIKASKVNTSIGYRRSYEEW